MTTTRVAKAIYKGPYGYDVRATVNGVTRFTRFPLDAKLGTMKAWQEDQRAAMRRTHPVLAKGTLAADITAYLERPDIKGMASYRQRARLLTYWSGRLGHKRRHTITAADIRDGLDALECHGAATRNKHRMALCSLWAALDGPSAGCPAKDVPKANEGQPPVRSLSPEGLDALLAHLNPRSKYTPFLRVLAHTGLPPGMLAQITPEMVDLERATVTVQPRRKGRGMPGRVLPITAAAVEAFRGWLAVRTETWDYRQMRRQFKRAAKAAGFPSARVYDLRHTFLTRVAHQFGVQAAMGLGLHATITTTQRYVNGAVQPLMAEAIAALDLVAPCSSRPETPMNTVH